MMSVGIDPLTGVTWSDWECLGGHVSSDPVALAIGGAAWTFHRGMDDGIYFKLLVQGS